MRNKKAMLPVLDIVTILIVTVLLFIYFAALIFNGQQFNVDERHLQSQLITTTIIQSGCFFDDFGYINKTLMTDSDLQKCLGLDDSDKIGINISLQSSSDNIFVNKARYTRDSSRCGIGGSTVFCSTQAFPVRIIEIKNGEKYEKADLLYVLMVLT